MGLSTEMRNYLAIFIRATPDPRYDPEIWHEMSVVRRCGRGLACRDPRPALNEREIQDVIMYLVTVNSLNSGSAFLSRGDMRNALLSAFKEWPPAPKPPTP